jgi:hypothetical protein
MKKKAHCGTTAAALAATRITTTTTTDIYNFLSETEKICMPLDFSLTLTITNGLEYQPGTD